MSDRIRTIRRKKGEKKPESTDQQVEVEAQQSESPTTPTPKPKPKATGPRIDAAALEAEAKALDAEAMAALMAGGAPKDPEPGQQVEGTVASISDSAVFVNIGAKSEGTIDRSTLADPDGLTVGDTISAFVVRVSSQGIKLAEKLSTAGSREMLEEAYRGRIPVEGVIEGRNPGGFNVMLSGTKAFCPASQIGKHAGEELDDLIGQTMVFVITEFKERDVVVSHRAHQEAQLAEEASQVWDKLKVGDIKEGAVVTIQDFGVFVELGGVQGLLHKSELGQGADVELPSVGDSVTVRVKSIDRAKERISLGLKDEPTGPWAAVGTDFVEGEAYTGTVSRIMDFGAFVKLAEGLEGLVHISQLAHHRVDHPSSVVRQGQEVKVRILDIDEERKRIGLSMRDDAGDGRNAWKKHQRNQDSKKSQSLGTFADLLGDLKLS
jgi:small subunit ribosomal protein S1